MSSNGILIPEFISLFDKVDSVQISIDGDEDVHDFIRGKGVYSKAVQTLHMLNDVGIPHSIAFTVCKERLCLMSLLRLLNLCSMSP